MLIESAKKRIKLKEHLHILTISTIPKLSISPEYLFQHFYWIIYVKQSDDII